MLSARGVQLVEEKEKRHRRKLNGWNQVFFFVIGSLSLSHRAASLSRFNDQPNRKHASETTGDAPATVTAWQQLTAKRTQTTSQTFYGIWHRQKARNIGHQNKIQYNNWIAMETFVSRERMLTTAPLALNFLSVCRICSGLSPCILYTSLYLIHSYSPPPSFSSLEFKSKLHHWRDRKEADAGYLSVNEVSRLFSLRLNWTACDILFLLFVFFFFVF